MLRQVFKNESKIFQHSGNIMIVNNYDDFSKNDLIQEIKKLKKRKKFGLVWKDKQEEG